MLPRNPSRTSYKLLPPAFPRLRLHSCVLLILQQAGKMAVMHATQFGA